MKKAMEQLFYNKDYLLIHFMIVNILHLFIKSIQTNMYSFIQIFHLSGHVFKEGAWLAVVPQLVEHSTYVSEFQGLNPVEKIMEKTKQKS